MEHKKILIGGIGSFNKETNSFQVTTADQLKDLFQKNGIACLFTNYHKNRFISLLSAVKTIWKNRQEIDIAILPLFGTFNSLLWHKILSVLLKKLHIKVVAVVHGGSIPEQLSSNPDKFLPSLKRADTVVVPSGFIKDALKKFNIDALIIENAINLSDYEFHLKKTIRPKIIWMRSFSDLYNPKMAVRVAKIMAQKYPEFKMVMAGADKGQLAEIKNMIEDNNLTEKIQIAGYIDLPIKNKLAQEFDVYICTNKVDNAPVSVIEFMALGLPVVSVEIGGIPYIIEHEKNGLLVEPDNDNGMADKIDLLISDAALSQKIIEDAKKYTDSYDEINILHKWNALFVKLRA